MSVERLDERVATTDLATLGAIQRRVLWLATSIVHHANHVRPNSSGVKVGGHQASSASMVSIMTALWFAFLEALPLVSVMDGHPHALSFLGSIRAVPAACLGVTEFGQSGDVESLYEHHGIDVEIIIGAALDVSG